MASSSRTMQVMTPVMAPDLYQPHVNPQWAKLLELLEMNVQYERCEGAELHVADGRTILDFLSGYGVHNTGHHHPRIIPAAFGQMLVRRMFRESHVPTQISGNNFVVLKASPPLVVKHAQIDQFVDGVTDTAVALGTSGALWTEALALARGVLNI